MKSRRTGLLIFVIGAVYMVVMGWLASWCVVSTLKNLTPDQMNETVWALDSVWFNLWALSVPLGSLLVMIGILLYAGSRGGRIWMFGVGVFVIVFLANILSGFEQCPPAFGVLGGVILACFLATMWFWSKKRKSLEGSLATAADFHLVGYVFFIVAAWYLCGYLNGQYYESLKDFSGSPIHIIMFLATGWFFLFLGHYKESRAIENE